MENLVKCSVAHQVHVGYQQLPSKHLALIKELSVYLKSSNKNINLLLNDSGQVDRVNEPEVCRNWDSIL